ncbi:hypothetical protein [Micromonospora haikouensis]
MADRLEEYRRRRDAKRTPEPVPGSRRRAAGPVRRWLRIDATTDTTIDTT